MERLQGRSASPSFWTVLLVVLVEHRQDRVLAVRRQTVLVLLVRVPSQRGRLSPERSVVKEATLPHRPLVEPQVPTGVLSVATPTTATVAVAVVEVDQTFSSMP